MLVCATGRSQKATGHQMNIPMPGHPVPDVSVAQVEKDVKQLEELVDQHDVVYLLMDSRESRWLPTLLGAAKGKVSSPFCEQVRRCCICHMPLR